jgi:hypothetical protein
MLAAKPGQLQGSSAINCTFATPTPAHFGIERI